MIITAIHIGHFGKLSDFDMTFDRSLHIIEGENETGKSTIAAFIRFMLYGLAADDPTSVERALSRASGTAEGTMTVEVKGEPFRLERKSVRAGTGEAPRIENTSRVINLVSGQTWEGVTAGEMWLGFPRSIYRRIACFGQMTETKVNDSTMRESIENLLFSGDEKVNMKHATAILTERRDRLAAPDGSGEVDRLRRERDRLAALRDRAAETNREILNVKAKLDTTREKHRETTGLLRELDDLDTLYRNTQLLVAFDKLHEIKRQTNDVSSRLLEMKRENSHTGFIPDQEYLTELGVNRQLYAEARHACRQAEEDLHEVERAEVIGADVQRNLQYTLKHGGEKNVLRETALLHNRTAWAGVFALLLAFLIVGAAVVAGVWLPPMYRAGGFDAILVYVLVFGIGSLLCVGGDVGLWILVRDKAAKERAYYLDFGARNRRELLIRLRNIAEYRSRAADQLMRIRAAHKYCEKTEAVRLAAEQELVKSLGRWGREPDEDADILAYTDQVERSARTYLDTVAMLKEEKSRLDAAASQLRAQLEGQNEAAIRAKVPKNSREKMRGITPEEIAGSIATQKRRAELLSKSEEMLSAKLALLRENAADPASVSEMLCETERALIRAERHLAALEYALSTLYKVDDRLKARIVPRLASHALELIKSMSGGVYRDLSMSDDLSLELKKGNEGFATEMLSAGTRDIAYMALRIAMIFMVCREEKPPLCLDECFAYQDDNRALEMMKMLKEQADKGIQSLVFTCRAREEILAHQAFGPHIGYTKLEYTA